jgi:hypothetical protein
VLDSSSRVDVDVDMVQVTGKDRFAPVTGLLIGGKAVML